jgi:hypothetical protein
MTHKENLESIIKFGNKFDYSFIYINAKKQKGIIICPEHGNFMKSPENI